MSKTERNNKITKDDEAEAPSGEKAEKKSKQQKTKTSGKKAQRDNKRLEEFRGKQSEKTVQENRTARPL